jgi:hypothetical protein
MIAYGTHEKSWTPPLATGWVMVIALHLLCRLSNGLYLTAAGTA